MHAAVLSSRHSSFRNWSECWRPGKFMAHLHCVPATLQYLEAAVDHIGPPYAEPFDEADMFAQDLRVAGECLGVRKAVGVRSLFLTTVVCVCPESERPVPQGMT